MYDECCSWLFAWIKFCSCVILYIKWLSCMLLWDVESAEEKEKTVLCILDIFHAILVHNHDNQTSEFAKNLICSSWFISSFSCLDLYPTERVKHRVYLMMSSLIEGLLQNDCGRHIRDAVSYLPSEPNDLQWVDDYWWRTWFALICNFVYLICHSLFWLKRGVR